ncbi:unnamed protein product [Caenorhabditis sp. 36 PRJEB53466]|nr:unnamed protein product [Caenorhabditis sp. 36 PRJEB53466]
MSFAGGFEPVPYEVLFEEIKPTERMSRSDWDAQQNPTQKRRKTVSVLTKKRAKWTRDDETITDEIAKKAAGEMLDEIQDTPGRITLHIDCPQSAGLCPLPSEIVQIEASNYSIDSLHEGQLGYLLAHGVQHFNPLGLAPIRKGVVKTEIPPREMPLKEAIEKLKKPDKWTDEYVGFSAAIANILRKCDVETAEKVAESLATVLENEALVAVKN